MSKYEEDRLSITLPVRFSPVQFQQVHEFSWNERKSYAEWIRGAVIDALKQRGIELPGPMNWQKKLDQQVERKSIIPNH